jgi:hypothetical protein
MNHKNGLPGLSVFFKKVFLPPVKNLLIMMGIHPYQLGIIGDQLFGRKGFYSSECSILSAGKMATLLKDMINGQGKVQADIQVPVEGVLRTNRSEFTQKKGRETLQPVLD